MRTWFVTGMLVLWNVGCTPDGSPVEAAKMPKHGPAGAPAQPADKGNNEGEGIMAEQEEVHRCPLHGTPLEQGEVRVVYGLLHEEPAYTHARETLFPRARTFAIGGCVVDPDHTHETVEFCPKCREVLRAWNAEQRRGR